MTKGGALPTLAELCVELETLGITLTDLCGVMMIKGVKSRLVRLRNPTNGRKMMLPILPDDEIVSPYLIGNIERTLKITTGFTSA